jgi:hypothetical protein
VQLGSPADVAGAISLYRQAMEIDNQTEATMQAATLSSTATLSHSRYGHAPQAMFAATRAGAERRGRETAAAATVARRRSRPAQGLISTLAARFARSTS